MQKTIEQIFLNVIFGGKLHFHLYIHSQKEPVWTQFCFINSSMNIRLKTYCALNRISFLKHIVNHLNDGIYYVNINFKVYLHNSPFHIYIYIYILEVGIDYFF